MWDNLENKKDRWQKEQEKMMESLHEENNESEWKSI